METAAPLLDKEEVDPVEYKPCRICGRTFHPLSLARHESVCEKSRKTIQRKKFDSFHQRTKDIITLPAKPEIKKQNEPKTPKKRWREQHEELMKIVRSDKDSPSKSPSKNGICPTQKVIPLGYIQCPVCRRCFNHKAADRHISWCQEQISRVPKSPSSAEALQRLKARIQYRAPLPGKKKNSTPDNQRLVKSADSCKTPSVQRTYSSPGLLNSRTKQVAFQEPERPPARGKSCERSPYEKEYVEKERKCYTLPSRISGSKQGSVVRFKESFGSYSNAKMDLSYSDSDKDSSFEGLYFEDEIFKSDRNQNYDILSALQLQLAQLRPNCNDDDDDEDVDDDGNYMLPDANYALPEVLGSKQQSPSKKAYDNFLSNAECFRSGSTGSAGSTAPRQDSGPRMPRFCYQCGTKYPVPSAKYCCECGSKRLVLSPERNVSSVS